MGFYNLLLQIAVILENNWINKIQKMSYPPKHSSWKFAFLWRFKVFKLKPHKKNTKERQLKISSNMPNIIYQNLKPAKYGIQKKIVVLETLHSCV